MWLISFSIYFFGCVFAGSFFPVNFHDRVFFVVEMLQMMCLFVLLKHALLSRSPRAFFLRTVSCINFEICVAH